MKAIYHRCTCTVIACSTYFNARFLSHFNMACIKLAIRRRKVLSYINCFFFWSTELKPSECIARITSNQENDLEFLYRNGILIVFFLLCRGLWVDHERNVINENISGIGIVNLY